jgi:hypothetical protein
MKISEFRLKLSTLGKVGKTTERILDSATHGKVFTSFFTLGFNAAPEENNYLG